MQLTYEQTNLVADDELAPEETRDIPFFGFVMGTLLSLGLWSVIAWTVWAVLS
ncbi:MAG: hypothetical protein ACHQ4J_04380 [Candidatus Binatia bacterium]